MKAEGWKVLEQRDPLVFHLISLDFNISSVNNTFPRLPTESLGLGLVFHVSAIYKYGPKEVRSSSAFLLFVLLSQRGKNSLEHFTRPWQELLLLTLPFQGFSSLDTWVHTTILSFLLKTTPLRQTGMIKKKKKKKEWGVSTHLTGKEYRH